MKKIVVIKECRIHNSVDGIDVILSKLFAQATSDKDLSYILMSNARSKGAELAKQHCNVIYIPYPSSGFTQLVRRFLGLIQLIFKIKSLSPSIIIYTQPYQILFALPFLFKSKIVHYHHSSKPFLRNKNGFPRLYLMACWTLAYKFTNLNISVCNTATQAFGQLSRAPLIEIQNGFPEPIDINSFKDRLNKSFSNSQTIVVGVGRMNRRKGGYDFAQVAKKLSYYNNIKFIWIGLPKTPQDEMFCEKYSMYVNFLGYRSDVKSLLEKASIGLFLSHEESTSICLRDMMSAGLPIVAWDIQNVSADLSHQKDLLVDFGNYNKAILRILDLHLNREKLLEFSRINRDHSLTYTILDQYTSFRQCLLEL